MLDKRIVEFRDGPYEFFFIEEGVSLQKALGNEFENFKKKFLEGIDKAFYELPVEKEYKNLFSFYKGFSDIKLSGLINDFSIDKNDPLIKEYEDNYFNIRAITIWEKQLNFGCLVLDPDQTIFEGVAKIIEQGKDSFNYAFKFDGNYKVIVIIKF